MFECILAWVFLFTGVVTQDPTYFVASGAFVIATQIDLWRKKK